VPSFCRHGRITENCPICSKAPRTRPGTVSDRSSSPVRRAERKPAAARSGSSAPSRRRAPRAGDVVVRRFARAADDGYENDLVPGLRATEDARRLADELAFAAARLEELSADPPGLYAEAGAAGDVEEGLWLAFLIAYLSPVEDGEDPFAGIAAARTSWASGELPDLEGVALGPRAGHDPKRGPATLTAYRARAERAGSQAAMLRAEPSLTPQRRFDRAFERLSLPGFTRAPRYEFLVLASRLGLVELEPWSLALGEAGDATTLAAKRVFGIGDTINLHRRSGELAAAAGIPTAALDLGLRNWAAPEGERVTAASRADVDPEVHERLASALRLPDPDIAGE
jgi:hypothetical protein